MADDRLSHVSLFHPFVLVIFKIGIYADIFVRLCDQ
jgi:hypothetical protein